MTLRVVSVVLLVGALLSGCAAPGPRYEAPERLPTYDEVAQRFNARVARLHRVWSRVNLTLRSETEDGASVDRAEGYLQVELPDRTALSVMKLGEHYFYFGSDGELYWWLDMSDRDRKVALYGLLSEATPELVAQLGLPVHPRELLDLFAITPLPPDPAAKVTWDGERGLLLVRTEGLWGPRLLWLDPVLLAPQRVELLGARGDVVRAECEMDRYISVPVQGEGRVPPKMASQYRVEFPEQNSKLTLELYGAANKDISPRAFDFSGLVEAYGIDEVLRLRPEGGVGE